MSETSICTSPTTPTEGLAAKFLTFQLDGEEYGIKILAVREIIGLMGITVVPRTADCIRGVINLRGKIIPVLDLRVKFGMESAQETDATCIIVVDLEEAGTTLHMGILVDAVCEVLDIQSDDIEPTPAFGGDEAFEFILGMAKCKGGVKILLKVEKIIAGNELVTVISNVRQNEEEV